MGSSSAEMCLCVWNSRALLFCVLDRKYFANKIWIEMMANSMRIITVDAEQCLSCNYCRKISTNREEIETKTITGII